MIVLFRIMLISLLISLFMVPESKADNSIYLPDQNTSITIKNFGKVSNCLHRGGQPKLNELCQLKNCGIKTIINLRKPFYLNNNSNMLKEQAAANELGMNFINIPLNHGTPPTNKQIEYFFNIINNPQNLPVFIHCGQGKDRTGIITALYRVHCCGWNYDQAYSEMRSYGYHVFLFPRLKYFLKDYNKSVCNCKSQTSF